MMIPLTGPSIIAPRGLETPHRWPLNARLERKFLLDLFRQSLRAIDPFVVVPEHLPVHPLGGRTIVLGAGKAAGRMAAAVERHWRRPIEGLVVTPYGHFEPTCHIKVVEAAYPVADASGRAAVARMMKLASSAGKEDLVLILISGGSAAALPAQGFSAELEATLSEAVSRSGMTMDEMNCVHAHLSASTGLGKLAAACGKARVVTLIMSDMPEDALRIGAVGVPATSKTTPQQALALLDRHVVGVPEEARAVLAKSAAQALPPQGPREVKVIASAQTALEAAARLASANGWNPLVLGATLKGDAPSVAAVHAGIARQVREHGQPQGVPCVILSGGQTTTVVRGSGRGGRNTDFLLSLVAAARNLPLAAIACDTAGLDGSGDNAGAFIFADTLTRARVARVDLRDHLARNDAYGFFKRLGDLVFTGATKASVNDFRAILVC